MARTGLPRATVHRLAVGLEHHGLARRDPAGRFRLGPRMAPPDPLPAVAAPALRRLRDDTGESAQLYVRRGDVRMCVAAAERPAGLRDTVPVGSTLPMTAGSAAKVLLAFGEEGFSSAPAPVEQGASVPGASPGCRGASPESGRGTHRALTPRRWRVSAGRAGRSASASGKAGWPRCRHRCAARQACSPRSRSRDRRGGSGGRRGSGSALGSCWRRVRWSRRCKRLADDDAG